VGNGIGGLRKRLFGVEWPLAGGGHQKMRDVQLATAGRPTFSVIELFIRAKIITDAKPF
jgi:hypothetical protein